MLWLGSLQNIVLHANTDIPRLELKIGYLGAMTHSFQILLRNVRQSIWEPLIMAPKYSVLHSLIPLS